jgi:hypothetical protein
MNGHFHSVTPARRHFAPESDPIRHNFPRETFRVDRKHSTCVVQAHLHDSFGCFIFTVLDPFLWYRVTRSELSILQAKQYAEELDRPNPAIHGTDSRYVEIDIHVTEDMERMSGMASFKAPFLEIEQSYRSGTVELRQRYRQKGFGMHPPVIFAAADERLNEARRQQGLLRINAENEAYLKRRAAAH